MGKKSRAALLVSKSCYKAAFGVLWSAKGARKPMMDFLSKQLKLEVSRGGFNVVLVGFKLFLGGLHLALSDLNRFG